MVKKVPDDQRRISRGREGGRRQGGRTSVKAARGERVKSSKSGKSALLFLIFNFYSFSMCFLFQIFTKMLSTVDDSVNKC